MDVSTGHPSELRWADPDRAEGEGQRELIIALGNLTEQVMRIADHLTGEGHEYPYAWPPKGRKR